MFIVKKLFGDPCRRWSMREQALVIFWRGQKFERVAPPTGRNVVFRISLFGWIQAHVSNFVVSEPKFTGSYSPNAGEIAVDPIACLSDFGHLHPFRRYFRSKSEVVRNRAEFCTFFGPTFFWGGSPNSGTWIMKLNILPIAAIDR